MLERLPDYQDLEILSINCIEALHALPDTLGKLTKLKELIIDTGNGCTMNPFLPQSIGNLSLLQKLVLNGAQDPRGVGNDPPVQPRERHKFPASMSQLKNLTYLDLGRNGLSDIPSFVQDLPKLQELRFQWNNLRAIPSFVVNLRELRELRLDSNDLDDLPGFLNMMPVLTHVTLGNNCSITGSPAKITAVKKRFPRIAFDLTDEYDCP